MVTYLVSFSSADAADRAAARLRARGIPVQQYLTAPQPTDREPGLLVGEPFGYPATLSSPPYTTGLINGLPQTDGSAVILPMPFFSHAPAGSVRTRITVMDSDAARTRRLLVNSGGNQIRIMH